MSIKEGLKITSKLTINDEIQSMIDSSINSLEKPILVSITKITNVNHVNCETKLGDKLSNIYTLSDNLKVGDKAILFKLEDGSYCILGG